jgi:hypothetical protein
MRHDLHKLALPLPIATLPFRMSMPAATAILVSAIGFSLLLLTGKLRADPAAINIAAITFAADGGGTMAKQAIE